MQSPFLPKAPRWSVEVIMIRVVFVVTAVSCAASMLVYCVVLRKVEQLPSGNATATTSSWLGFEYDDDDDDDDGGAVVHYVGEKHTEENEAWSPYDVIYFVCTTFLGTGYGDVVPDSFFGRLWVKSTKTWPSSMYPTLLRHVLLLKLTLSRTLPSHYDTSGGGPGAPLPRRGRRLRGDSALRPRGPGALSAAAPQGCGAQGLRRRRLAR